MHDGHGWRDESEVEFVEATRDRVWSLTDDQMDLPRAHCS